MRQTKKATLFKGHSEVLKLSHLGPAQVLVIGFLIIIVMGAVILSLPISSSSGEGTSFLDALFTATSAVCVTGLVVVNTFAHWSNFGKVVIILLIQIGGLGFMTLVGMIFVLLGRKITLRDRMLMQESLSQDTTAGIVRFVKYVVKGTLLVEGIGALLLATRFVPEHGILKGICYSIFHAISAFCNAGFDIIGDTNLTPYVGDVVINFTVMSLIIMGGLGFGVWSDILYSIKYRFKNRDKTTWKQVFHKLPLHSKLVVVISSWLILAGFLFFFLAEFTNPNTLGILALKEKILAALFQSVSPRTAGFNTIPLGMMTDASKFMMIILMFIGGSPAGTAGGIKTVTVGILALSAIAAVKGKDTTEIFERRVANRAIMRSLAVIMIGLFIVIIFTMILTFTEDASFLEILFEVTSGFGTVGNTLGLTPNLTVVGKLIIILDMFIGRLGTVTMGVAIMIRQGNHKAMFQYPEEKVII